jgi:PAS domain S-box-containing protein
MYKNESKYDLLKQIAESITDVFFTFDKKLRYTYWNNASEALTGISAKDALGKSLYDLFPKTPETVKAHAFYKKVLKAGQPGCLINSTTINNIKHVFEINAYPIESGLSVIVKDITERKLAEEKLIISEEKYRTIFENSIEGLFQSTPDGRFLKANTALAKMLGYKSPNELVSSLNDINTQIYANPEDRNTVKEFLLKNGFIRDYEVHCKQKNGNSIWIVLNMRSVFDDHGHILYFEGSGQDITQRKKADENIKKLLERLNLATSSANLGIWDWDVIKNELVWDDRMYTLYGIKREDFTGAYEAWLAGVHPEDRNATDELVNQALKGTSEYDTEFRVVWPDRSVHIIRAHGLIIKDPHGDPLRMTGINYDITELKQAEEGLKVRALQHAIVAGLGRLALSGADLYTLFNKATTQVADIFGMEYCTVLERLTDNSAVRIVAGTGWEEGVIGHATVSMGPDSQAGFTMQTKEPVIVEDFLTETRFKAPPILHDHGVISGLSVIIGKVEKPFGVLSTHTTHRRVFTSDDVNFFQSIANVLAEAIESKQAQEALKKSEAQLRAILDATPFPVALVDVNDNIIDFWSRSALILFGHTAPTASEWYEIAYPDPDYRKEVIERWKPALEKAQQSSQPVNAGEYRVTCHNGSVRICELYATFLEDRLVVTFNDITGRKLTEEVLSENEEKFRRLFEDHAAVKLLIDPDSGEIIDANLAAADFYGWSCEELKQMKVEHLNTLPPGEVIKNMESVRAQKRTHFEFRHRRKDGSIRDVEVFSSKIEIGNRVLLHSIIHDITKRKLAEVELIEAKVKAEASEDKFRNAFEYAAYAIALVSTERKFISVNQALISMLGYSAEELRGMTFSDITHPDDIKIGNDLVAEMYAGKREYFWLEKRYIHKDGHYVWGLLSTSLVRDAGKKPLFSIAQIQDITERKRAEEDLLRKKVEIEKQNLEYVALNEEYLSLNEELRTSNEELAAARDKAEESDRLKTAFLQNMSHEIRTPMNSIMGFSELLVKNFNNKDKLEKFSEIINQRCNDLLEIINDILDISKIESGQWPVNNEICNLVELFDELASFFKEHQKRIGKQEINFIMHCHCDASVSTIITDKIKLKQIFINLISNAFKFTEAGKIEGGCRNTDDQKLLFYVSDTGIGIPADKYEEVFERFIQLKNTKKLSVGGTGLGLSIVKGLIGLLGGDIRIESEVEDLSVGRKGGTTFYFSFPCEIAKSEATTTASATELKVFDLSGKTILLVEDDYFNTLYIKEILSETGVRIVHTDFGAKAAQLAALQMPDLVLMDIRLPDMSGYETIQQMLQYKPCLKIIAQTAYASHDDRLKALSAGCIGYISKPIKRDILFSLLNKHLMEV